MKIMSHVVLRLLAMLGLLGMLACLSSPAPKLVPMVPQEPTAIEWETVMPQRIAQADGVTIATITKLEADWDYDDLCGVVATAFHMCQGTVTYRLHLNPTGQWLWTFTSAYGNFGLYEGEHAVFIWRNVMAYRYKTCREQAAMSSAACPADYLPALTNDLDVIPASDSALVESLRRGK